MILPMAEDVIASRTPEIVSQFHKASSPYEHMNYDNLCP